MTALIVGLVIFLAVHSVRIVADGWRSAQIARLGENAWKGLYAVASAIGIGLVIWGYGLTRASPIDLWMPPRWLAHVTALVTLASFILIAAAYVRGTRIKAAVGHPMFLGVKAWAFAHLLSNGRLADVVLFGAFLVWAVLGYRAAKARDRAQGTVYPSGPIVRDVVAIALGVALWAAFAMFLHAWLIGVRPFG